MNTTIISTDPNDPRPVISANPTPEEREAFGRAISEWNLREYRRQLAALGL